MPPVLGVAALPPLVPLVLSVAAFWERVVDLSPVAGERLAIPYETTTLPGFFFPAPGTQPSEPRPLVVVNHGLDTPTSCAWAHGGAEAGMSGYHWMTFDGPGQQAALYEQGIACRPDWEAVLTPVLDALLVRPDVDPERVAVIGLGHGAYLVARALCFEHRFPAAIADPGIVDLGSSWIDLLPGRCASNSRPATGKRSSAPCTWRSYSHPRSRPPSGCWHNRMGSTMARASRYSIRLRVPARR